MGKQGPCYHCGITSTPLWRNGPPEKPVLCNACGSRWRTRGTLANYIPLHCRQFQSVDSDGFKNTEEYNPPPKTEYLSLPIVNRKDGDVQGGLRIAGYGPCSTGFEDDKSNKSSSGSGVSVSESCLQKGSMGRTNISALSHLWNFQIPSKKRTKNKRYSSTPVEKLGRDLRGILQKQESSYLSDPSEEVLLFEREDPMLSVETSLGSVLIKQPLSSTEEELEASSLSCTSDPYMGSSLPYIQSKSFEREIRSIQGAKDGVVLDMGEGGLKEHSAKQCALTDKSS